MTLLFLVLFIILYSSSSVLRASSRAVNSSIFFIMLCALPGEVPSLISFLCLPTRRCSSSRMMAPELIKFICAAPGPDITRLVFFFFTLSRGIFQRSSLCARGLLLPVWYHRGFPGTIFRHHNGQMCSTLNRLTACL